MSMVGKNCLITGATAGIGKATAKQLANTGATLGLICRNEEKAEQVVAEISKETGNVDINIHIADLACLASVQRVADEIIDSYESINILINNAGFYQAKRIETEDGLEACFGVNHLAHFYLTHLLLPTINNTPHARIINVASAAYMAAKLDLADLNWQHNKYRAMQAYGNSKLANILFTLELSKRLSATRTTVNCLHPGIIASNFADNFTLATKLFGIVALPWLRTSDYGAQTSVYLASSKDVAGITGKYFVKKKVKALSEKGRRPEEVQGLWEQSEKILAELGFPLEHYVQAVA